MYSNEITERVKCVERKPWDFHHWQARSAGFRHPSGQQNPASIWTFNHEVDQTRVDYAPEDGDPPPDEWMMRIFNDDLEVVFLGSMSLDCAEPAKVGLPAPWATRLVATDSLSSTNVHRASSPNSLRRAAKVALPV
jgi:hypothetical protein